MSASARHGSSRAQAWFCTTGLPSDVVFEVHDMTFHLHKFPLMAKSRKIHRMLTEQEEQRPARGRRRRRSPSSGGGDSGDDGAAETEIEEAEEEEEHAEEEQQQVRREGDGQPYSIAFPDFPGGPGTFEAAAKFCYGVRLDLTAWNVAPLRCAAEYLEMTEEHCEGNLAALAESFLEQTVLRHPGDATKSLKSSLFFLVIGVQAHPRLTAEERDRVVGVVDCRKLTVEACTHAAQNERLPLRAVLQVLFFEQLQLRRAITSTLLGPGGGGVPARAARQQQQQQRAGTSSEAAAVAWRGATALAQESQVLRLDMDSVASRVQELERECSSMRRAIKNIDGGRSPGGRSADGAGEGSGPAAAAGGWRTRHGCKFSTQVCDSHARNVVASRASRMGMSP
ncbi:unnamed protein product [Urochloa decumbens]|uniref:NPH3 domain-containing protein n=1 Tax=Urochloa decumbens TaxID=240449 RepID=A0ABC8YLC1_9POAL